jgi:hypothetical protein
MRGILAAYGVSDRNVWVADSFAGLPEPDPVEMPLEAEAHKGPMIAKVYNNFMVPFEDVQKHFKDYGLLDRQVRFLKGWFKDTLPNAPIVSLAILRLDGDYYESTRDALEALYHKLSVGGYVIVDDYAEDGWTCCRKAVDEFRSKYDIHDPLMKVDSKCYYWKRGM